MSTWATITNANVSASAAIVVSKLSPGSADTALVVAGGAASWAKLVNANIDAAAAIAVTKLAAGTQYQVMVAGASGVPGWGALDVSQATGLAGLGSSGQVPYVASSHLAFSSSLSFNSGTGRLTIGNLTVTGLTAGLLVSDGSGNISIGTGAGGNTFLNIDTVANAEAAVVTGYQDMAYLAVRELFKSYWLATGTFAVDHTSVLATPTVGRYWLEHV